jgi:hypothetical protein
MAKVTVKEIKDDAIIYVPVNKTYYLMVKSVLFDLFTKLQEKGFKEDTLQSILKKPYTELSQEEKSFYTITLLLGEIEKQATDNNLFEEKEFDAEKLVSDETKN